MRILVDSSVFISYLLQAHSQEYVSAVFRAVYENTSILLIPEALLREIYEAVSQTPSLSSLEGFLDALEHLSVELLLEKRPLPQASYDVKHDYLIAYALLGRADYLITKDKGLLTLDKVITEFSIITPKQFVEVIQGAN